jgi:type I restriction enzyme R subunit
MEHAIRWHIKVNMDKDPALYTAFNERLQKFMDAHKEHWNLIVTELNKLRDDLGKGRQNESSVVDAPIVPFYDLIVMDAGIDKTDASIINKTAKISEVIYSRIKEFILIPNCWQKSDECRQLESDIKDELEYSGIELLRKSAAKITTGLINLAEKRESEVRNS